MPLVSVIVPIYKVEKYLNKCVDSVLNQSYQDIEVILVDDGSPDNCPIICDEYAKKDERVKVIHKENGGLADARNAGLQLACGNYILFVDSDDYIAEGSLSEINKVLERNADVDVVFLNATKVYEGCSRATIGNVYHRECIYGKNHEEVMMYLSKVPKFPGSACNKLTKRSLIVDNNLYFTKGLLSEDIDWVTQLLLVAEKYDYCEHRYYFYRKNRKGSITNTVNINSVSSLIYIIKKWSKKSYDDCSVKNTYQNYINDFMVYEYVVTLGNYGNLPKEDKKKVKEDVHAYSWLLSWGKNRRTRIIKFASRILGLETVSGILGMYLRYKA